MALIQTVHLSMANFKSAPVVPAVQNDTDRQVKMIIDDYTLTSGLTGKIAFERSDGTHYETAAELVLADNAFVADIDQALTQPGRTMVQLKVTDTLTVSTFSFVIFVEADNSGTVTPQEGIDLVSAVEAAEDAADRAEEAAESLELDATLTSSTKAAQAKAVGDALEELKNELINAIYDSVTTINFSNAEIIDRIISSSTGKWILNGQSYMIPIPTGQDKLFIVSNATNGSILALLTDNAAASGTTPHYATGASRQFIEAGERSEFEIPSDCAYICLMKSYSTTNYTPQSAEYVVYKAVEDGSITKRKLDASLQATVDAVPELESHFVENENLVNPNTVTSHTIISSNGSETASNNYDTSDYINVEPGGKYSWKNLGYVCRYGVNKNWLGRTSATSQSSITLASTVYFVRVCGSIGTADNWRFNKGESVIDLPYIDGVYLAENVQLANQLDGVNENISTIQSDVDLLTPSYGVPYIPSIPYNYSGNAIVPYKTSGHLADIYALYDALVEQYPQYIHKQVLGMDASGLYEVRAYRIDNGTNYAYRYPRFVWLSSIHGNEGNTTISTYYMIKELLEKFGTDPVCYGIMSAVRLYVVPAVNPWGVENYSRLNANHVNLNRNFPVDWVYRDPNLAYGTEKYGIMSASNGDNPYYYYGGGTCVYDDATQTATTTYVAEAETQLIMNFINSLNTGANLNGKISFAVNKHDAGNMSEEGATILIRDNYESDRKFITNFLNWMKPLLMSKQNWLTEKNGLNLSTVSYDTAGDPASTGTMDKWLNYSGIHGCLCEIPKGAGTGYTDTEHFSDLCAINVDVGLNMMNNVIVNNAKLKDNTQTEQYTIVS